MVMHQQVLILLLNNQLSLLRIKRLKQLWMLLLMIRYLLMKLMQRYLQRR